MWSKPQLKVGRVGGIAGDDRLKLKGTFALAPGVFLVDPLANRSRFQVKTADDATVFDVKWVRRELNSRRETVRPSEFKVEMYAKPSAEMPAGHGNRIDHLAA